LVLSVGIEPLVKSNELYVIVLYTGVHVAYNNKSLELNGEFANLNIIPEEDI
jgi:hypothetical protein